MARPPHISFHFEKKRLLRRRKKWELWEGWIQEKPHLIVRFLSSRASNRDDYLLLSRTDHPLLLKPVSSGYSKNGSFCYAMPIDFSPDRDASSLDPVIFSASILSLILVFQQEGISLVWHPDYLVFDPAGKSARLCGAHAREIKSIHSHEAVQLNALSRFLSRQRPANHQALKIIRKWLRRKDSRIAGCLAELLSVADCIDQTVCVREWAYGRELELVAGLSRLAEQGKGRSLIFWGGAGEGKTTLLRQVQRDQFARGARIAFFSVSKEERPYQSIKKLLQTCAVEWGSIQDLPRDLTEDNVTESFLKLFRKPSTVFVVLIDGFQNMDVYSKRCLFAISRRITEYPVLLVSTSRNPMKEAEDTAVVLPITKPGLKQIEELIFVPLWQEKQRKDYFDQIYQKISGNTLLFYEYLLETIRQQQRSVQWHDGNWRFTATRVPAFPDGLLDFYWSNAPVLTSEELQFLQRAAVQGELFDVSAREEKIADALVTRNVLLRSSKQYRFQNRLFAEAILNRLEPARLKRIHQELAVDLSARSTPGSYLMLARHSLGGGDPSRALHWTSAAIRELGREIEPAALSLLEELDAHRSSLSMQEIIDLHTWQGNLYHRRGKYAAAAASFRRIWQYSQLEREQRFSSGVSIAESCLLQEDINAAQEMLAQLTSLLPTITGEQNLFRYYVAKGLYSHYRGPRTGEDFRKAFEVAEKIGDESLLAYGYRCSAWFLLEEGRLTETASHARKAMRFAKFARNHEELGSCYKIFASIAWRKSRHTAAEALMKKSIRAFQKANNHFGCAGVWNLLGNVYVEKYQFQRAIECFERSIQLFGYLDHPREVSFAQFNLGLAHLEMGRLKEAEKIFVRCRDIDKRSGNRWFYAYDLRALAVYCILQGYPRKAERLLKKTIEICEQLSAEGDILQTKMILLFLYLQQRNFRDAASLVSFLEEVLSNLKEPLSVAEIHHLLAYYYGHTNEIVDAVAHLKKSDQLAQRIEHFKLLAKNRILNLVLRGAGPQAEDPEFRKAVRYFRKSRNHLEFCDYLLLLYQTYPSLLKNRTHARKGRWMESIYKDLQITSRLRGIRKLLPAGRSRAAGGDPAYEWWNRVLNLFNGSGEFENTMRPVLQELSAEFDAPFCAIHYLNHHGTFERIVFSREPVLKGGEDLPAQIFGRVFHQKNPLCIDIESDAELARSSWVIVNQVRSILAVPFLRSEQLLGIWYFERRSPGSAFSNRDVQKLNFFARVSLPYLENAIQSEASRTAKHDSIAGIQGTLIGSSKPMQQLVRLIEKIAPLDVSVLIQGESGTGKELIARSIHQTGKRGRGPFIALNCSAIPETLIESELFGHSRGAFTGAVSAKAGSVERAHRGTLFLDEIGDLSLSAQAKLLRVIQEREIQRLGEASVRKVDVRFVFATHKDLMKMVKAREYREDLFYRIRGYVLDVPPLRERKEDIPVLANHFLEKYSSTFGKANVSFSLAAMKLLCDYWWPGNIREMENLIQTILVNSDSDSTVECEAFRSYLHSTRLAPDVEGISLEEGREQFDREFVCQALERHRWNKSKTAKELKITRQGLINMIHRLKLENP